MARNFLARAALDRVALKPTSGLRQPALTKGSSTERQRRLTVHAYYGVVVVSPPAAPVTPTADYLNRKFSRVSWSTEVQPISFIPRSISARMSPSARSTPA
jgi:hypothetical protein